MSSELLASGVDNLKGHLAGAFNVLTGSSGDYTDLGIGRKFGGAAAAYSLRDIGAMNGPVVRVRRDSDNAERDFSALAISFIADFVGSGNNGFVETWYDQSGNGRDITNTTASEQPKIVSSGALVTATNNLPAIDFTTSLTRLARTEFLTGQLSTYFSIYQGEAGDSSESQVVFRQGASYRLNNAIQTSGKIRAQIRDGGGDAVNLDAGGDLATGSPLLQTTLIGARGANGLTIFVNGANEANADTSDVEDTDFAAADSGDFAIGGVYNSNSFDFVGKGQEFIFYHSNLSSDRTVIESNINNHYSIF